MTYCKECFIKQQKINELEAEIASLKYLCSQTESKVQKSSLVCLILYKSQVILDIVEPGLVPALLPLGLDRYRVVLLGHGLATL